MSCPGCEGQGNIYKAKILELKIIIKICDECEACWKENQPITIENFKRLATFLKENGLNYNDAVIQNLEYINMGNSKD